MGIVHRLQHGLHLVRWLALDGKRFGGGVICQTPRIDVTVPNHDGLAGQANQTLDVVLFRIARILEDDDIPPLRFFQQIGELAHQNPVAIERILVRITVLLQFHRVAADRTGRVRHFLLRRLSGFSPLAPVRYW